MPRKHIDDEITAEDLENMSGDNLLALNEELIACFRSKNRSAEDNNHDTLLHTRIYIELKKRLNIGDFVRKNIKYLDQLDLDTTH